MELGLFTACLPRLGLADIAAWCVRSGYQTLEVAAWPVGSEQAHQASHRYRVPGRGQLDWNRIIDVLHDGGFSETVAVEHEDPVWSGSEAKVKWGLEIAARTLGPLVLGG
ncbi:hypothetical protein ACG83_11775 [Frankia sp. R43]|uniref:hypothetical protein n=1 Tax=Frankia sp. R43 TaxID=269536 RepID=UPI0006CA0055|nr:hypothetical protein [Frankia sp. R43]KPM55905.1 hypothetical protein ACG83_11775 [Frankia sp. R43]